MKIPRKKILLIDSQGRLMPRRQLFFNALRRKGYDVKGLMWDRTGKMLESEEVEGVVLKRVKVKGNYVDVRASLKTFSVYLKMARLILREEFDVIHCGHYALLPLCVSMGRLKKARVIYDVAEFYSKGFFGRVPDFLQRVEKVANFIENRLVEKVSGVLCPPSRSDVYYKRYRRHNKNTRVVMNVPELKERKVCEEQLVSLRTKYSGRRVIGFCGVIDERNGAFEILAALPEIAREFPEVLLLFIGIIGVREKAEIGHSIEKMNMEQTVDFVGFVPYKKLQKYLMICDIAVSLPRVTLKSSYSLCTVGNSRKHGDYMHASLPIVASNSGEFNLVVKKSACGILVDASEPRNIAKAICYLFRNPAEAKRMGENGRATVEEWYNWEAEKKNLELVYDNIW